MTPVPAELFVLDHTQIAAALTLRRTMEIGQGKEIARHYADHTLGRFLLLLLSPGAPLEKHTDDEAEFLAAIQDIFTRNDCSLLTIQWAVSDELREKILALRATALGLGPTA